MGLPLFFGESDWVLWHLMLAILCILSIHVEKLFKRMDRMKACVSESVGVFESKRYARMEKGKWWDISSPQPWGILTNAINSFLWNARVGRILQGEYRLSCLLTVNEVSSYAEGLFRPIILHCLF